MEWHIFSNCFLVLYIICMFYFHNKRLHQTAAVKSSEHTGWLEVFLLSIHTEQDSRKTAQSVVNNSCIDILVTEFMSLQKVYKGTGPLKLWGWVADARGLGTSLSCCVLGRNQWSVGSCRRRRRLLWLIRYILRLSTEQTRSEVAPPAPPPPTSTWTTFRGTALDGFCSFTKAT